MICTDQRRAGEAHAKGLNGIDAVNVGADRSELTVVFFGKAPENLSAANFAVEGGTRVTGIRVTGMALCAREDPDLEDRVRLTLDRAGDLSTYRLCVVGVDGFDPRSMCIDFRFVTGCDDLDCAPTCSCPEPVYPPAEIDYLAKDYASFRQLMLDRLSLTMPGWTERHIPDIGVALVELLAYEGDRLSYRQDAVATEAYLGTARLRTSVRRHTRLVDYAMHDGCAARAWVCVEVSGDAVLKAGSYSFTAGTQGFEPLAREDVSLYCAHNEIALWTWGDRYCCLPVGATGATLVDSEPGKDRVLHLAAGDVLIFEETIGARTGVKADKDLSHRQAVRLTTVTAAVDPLADQPLLEVGWAREDALCFPLCVDARGGPDCEHRPVGVARGNVVLVEHGAGGATQTLDVPVQPPPEPVCPDPGCFGCPDITPAAAPPRYPPIPPRFSPLIGTGPVTQTTTFPPPNVVARGQGSWLRGLPDRARRQLVALQAKAAQGPLSDTDTAYLTTLFGQVTLARLHLADNPQAALGALLARFDELLQTKLARLQRLIARARGGYVLTAATEGWEIAHSWGRQEGDDIDPDRPLFQGPAAAATLTDPRTALPAITVVDQHGEDWESRRDLLDSGPNDRHFVGETDDDAQLWLRFGDGRNGAVFPLRENPPGPDDPVATARYRVGNGAAGNVGAEAIDAISAPGIDGLPITRVRNPLPATGGVDPETVAEARMRAPSDARLRQLRAVTAADYADFAGQIPGVQRAAANLAWTGSWYEAQVGVDALGGPTAPSWMLDEVRWALHRYRRIGHDLAVSTATLVPLDLALCVQVTAGYLSAHVRAGLLRALGSGAGGYFQPDRLTFGTPVRVSGIVAAAAAVPGVLSADVTELERLFGPPANALDTGVLTMRPLEVARLDNDPTRPENGRLQLTLVGGR